MKDALPSTADESHAKNAIRMRWGFALLVILIMASVAWPFVAATAEDSQSGDTWIAPASEAAKKNPVAASPGSVAAGQKVYSRRCAGCHGTSGNGDGPNAADLGIHPAKLSEVTGGESDGSLFWKITTGKKPMPRYGGRLSETDRWNVINYIRTLAKR